MPFHCDLASLLCRYARHSEEARYPHAARAYEPTPDKIHNGFTDDN